MEDILQRIFAIFVTALVFFILPIYIAYEKMDDISYALALKITTSFVEDVTSKGYLSRNMYNDYVNKLSTTNNTYDIELEHVSKKYYPVFLVYTDDTKKSVKGTYDYMLYKDSYNNTSTKMNIDGEDVNKNRVTVTYKVSEEKIYTSQIMDVLDRNFDNTNATNTVYANMDLSKYKNLTSIPAITTMYQLDNVNTSADKNIYTMNTGDEFNVVIKNKNTTIATVLFNTFTMGNAGGDNNTRVFVNYGGTIENMDYVNTVESAYSYKDYVGYENDDKFKVLLDGEYNKKDGHNSGFIINTTSDNSKWTNLKVPSTDYAISSETSYNGDSKTGVIADPSWESNGLTFKRKSYLKIDDLNINSMKNGYTIEIVLKYDNIEKDPSKTGSVRSITPIGNYNEGGMGIEYSTKFKKNYFTMGFDDGTGTNTYKMVQSSVDASANKIYSLSASYNGNNMVFYENGRKTTLDVRGLTPNIATSYSMTIGLNPGPTNEFHFGGTIYSVRIYNRALTDSEILKNYEVDKSRFNIY